MCPEEGDGRKRKSPKDQAREITSKIYTVGIATGAYLAQKQYQKVKYLEVRFGTGQSRLDPLEVGRDGGGKRAGGREDSDAILHPSLSPVGRGRS